MVSYVANCTLCNAYTLDSALDSEGKGSRSHYTKSPCKFFIAERPVIFRVEVLVISSLFLMYENKVFL